MRTVASLSQLTRAGLFAHAIRKAQTDGNHFKQVPSEAFDDEGNLVKYVYVKYLGKFFTTGHEREDQNVEFWLADSAEVQPPAGFQLLYSPRTS